MTVPAALCSCASDDRKLSATHAPGAAAPDSTPGRLAQPPPRRFGPPAREALVCKDDAGERWRCTRDGPLDDALRSYERCAHLRVYGPRLGARIGSADRNALGRGSWSLPRRAARIALYTGGSLCSRTAAGERHDDAPAPAGHVGPTSSSVSESPRTLSGGPLAQHVTATARASRVADCEAAAALRLAPSPSS